MPVNCSNTLVCSSLQQLACDDLLNSQNYAILAPNANRGSAVLYRLDCIFDLEVPTVGREYRVREIVARTNGSLLRLAWDELCIAGHEAYHDEFCLVRRSTVSVGEYGIALGRVVEALRLSY